MKLLWIIIVVNIFHILLPCVYEEMERHVEGLERRQKHFRVTLQLLIMCSVVCCLKVWNCLFNRRTLRTFSQFSLQKIRESHIEAAGVEPLPLSPNLCVACGEGSPRCTSKKWGVYSQTTSYISQPLNA